MPNKTIRVGVIGVGQTGKKHLETYLSIPGYVHRPNTLRNEWI